MSDHRAEALAHLQAIHDELIEELGAIAAAIAALAGDRPAAKVKKRRPPSVNTCEQCGRVFDQPQGLAMHITRSHGRPPELDAKRAERMAAELREANR